MWETTSSGTPRRWVRGIRSERREVSNRSETPFDSIEGSHEYVALLAEAIEEARREVEADLAVAVEEGAERRKQALQLVIYNLAKLSLHITASRRILNDLRTLRRLLLAERQPGGIEIPVAEEGEAERGV
jgi:hypothetical protein